MSSSGFDLSKLSTASKILLGAGIPSAVLVEQSASTASAARRQDAGIGI
jgi:hypothetical protein